LLYPGMYFPHHCFNCITLILLHTELYHHCSLALSFRILFAVVLIHVERQNLWLHTWCSSYKQNFEEPMCVMTFNNMRKLWIPELQIPGG
jgi:hypothetical protein